MSSIPLAGRRVWLTGASTGIGRACALEFARRGARLAISARNAPALEALASEIRSRSPNDATDSVLAVPLDVRDRGSNAQAAATIEQAWGGLDTAVFNAGVREFVDEDEFDGDLDPYTLHRNPVFVATRAIFAGLAECVEQAAIAGSSLAPADAFPLLRLLNAAEMAVVLGVQSLDLGDNTLGISQLKRALGLLNAAMGRLPEQPESETEANSLARAALPRIFDLREICLRVIREGRLEQQGPTEGEEPF